MITEDIIPYKIDLKNCVFIEEKYRNERTIINLVEDTKTKKKLITKTFLSGDISNLQEELQFMKYIHPTMLPYYGFSEKDLEGNSHLTILMEYAEKGSVDDVLQDIKNRQKDDSYNETAKLKTLLGTACCLMKMHEKELLHLDIKPMNVLYDNKYNPYVADYGLAQHLTQGATHITGPYDETCIYIAPEVYLEGKNSKKADVFSFGMFMYQIITLFKPFTDQERSNIDQLMFDICFNNKRPAFPQDTNVYLKELVEKCWAPLPEERPTSKEVFFYLAKLATETMPTNENNDNERKPLLDDIDIDSINKYLNMIKDSNIVENVRSASTSVDILKILSITALSSIPIAVVIFLLISNRKLRKEQLIYLIKIQKYKRQSRLKNFIIYALSATLGFLFTNIKNRRDD